MRRSPRAGLRDKWVPLVYADRDISDGCRVLLLLLAESMTDRGHVSVPREQLAEKLGIDKRRVTARITEATRAGLLSKCGGGFRGVTASYEALLKVAGTRPPFTGNGGGFPSTFSVHLSPGKSDRKVAAERPPNARASSNATEPRDGVCAGVNRTSRSPKDGRDEGVGSQSPFAANSPSRAGTVAGPGNPRCRICGRPNLYHPSSIERGICAACVRTAEVAS